jgi:hypothetical protein
LYAATMETSAVNENRQRELYERSSVRVRVVCGRRASPCASEDDVFWLACEPECDDVWTDCGTGSVNQSSSASRVGDSGMAGSEVITDS